MTGPSGNICVIRIPPGNKESKGDIVGLMLNIFSNLTKENPQISKLNKP